MTLFDPQITLRKMTVMRGSDQAYSADFHPGLNIIRGENSSGKSTILDFIFYGLGGDLTDWRESALLCSEVILEVELNKRPAVFAREISTSIGRPMRIFLGNPEGDNGSKPGWSLYPYRRSPSKESFSQAIFRLLGMPEATGDENNIITMNQILRLLYADQLSPVDRIFRLEPFDTGLRRQTVGDLLCGAYNNNLYKMQLRLREADKEHSSVSSEWRNLLEAFKGEKHALTIDWVNAQRAILNKRLQETHAEAERLEERIFNAELSDGLTLKEQKTAYSEMTSAQQILLALRAERDALQFEIADSSSFILALETKLAQLRDAEAAADVLKSITFLYCPSCFAPLDGSAGEHACSLCKSPFDKERAQSRVLSIINETGIQLKQSLQLQNGRNDELVSLDLRIAEAERRWSSLAERYKLLNRLPSTELRSQAREIYRRAGYLEREIEDLGRKSSIIERLEALSKATRDLNAEMTHLKIQIETAERQQQAQLRSAYALISSNTVEFLRRDLARQDTFTKAQSIKFDFSDDRISVDGESFFSASSMVYLRNSFFASFFKSSLSDPNFRHPRFLILDTIEDKGMEPERSHNFQNLLAEMSEDTKVEHQIIYATAMISPRLEASPYVVDRFYTHDSRTLNLA